MKAQRIRIRFSKTEAMRFTGHLDLRLTWERTFRRSGLPLAYSGGFKPTPQFNFALPLPLGFLSTAELGDFWLSEVCGLQEVQQYLTRALPPGLEIHSLIEIPDLHRDKLPTLVVSAGYQVELPQEHGLQAAAVDDLLAEKEIIRERRGKSYHLRPLILSMALIEGDDQLKMTLSALPGATGRPDEVLKALKVNPLRSLITRTNIILRKPEGD